MNYIKIYDELILRGFSNRNLEIYEKHHVIPRCMGGDDSSHNIVKLTPEEHYIAHLLLLKIHPDNVKLAYAANMMKSTSNKEFGWVRRKMKVLMTGRMLSEETKKKISVSQLGKKRSDDFKISRSKNMSGKKRGKYNTSGIPSKQKGIKRTEEFKSKVSAGVSGLKNPACKKFMIEGKLFHMRKDVAKFYEISDSLVTKRVKSSNYPTWKYYN